MDTLLQETMSCGCAATVDVVYFEDMSVSSLRLGRIVYCKMHETALDLRNHAQALLDALNGIDANVEPKHYERIQAAYLALAATLRVSRKE